MIEHIPEIIEAGIDSLKIEKDKKRKLNYRYFTGREWGERENYHLCIDSSRVGIERAADLIIMAAEND